MDAFSDVRLPQRNPNAGCIPYFSKAKPMSNGSISEYQSVYQKWMVYKQSDSKKPRTTNRSLLQLGTGCPATYTTNYKAEYEGCSKVEKRQPSFRRGDDSYKQPDIFPYGQSAYSAQYPYRPELYRTSRPRQIAQPTSLYGNNERKLAELYKEVVMEKRQPSHRRGEESYKQPDIFSYGQSAYNVQYPYPYRPDVYRTSRARQIAQPTSLYGNNERKLAELYKEVVMEKRQLSHRRGEESYKQPNIFPFQSSSNSDHDQYSPEVYKTSRARQIVQPTSLYGNNERKLAEHYKESEVMVQC